MHPDRSLPDDRAALPQAELHIRPDGAVRHATLEEFCTRSGAVRRPSQSS